MSRRRNRRSLKKENLKKEIEKIIAKKNETDSNINKKKSTSWEKFKKIVTSFYFTIGVIVTFLSFYFFKDLIKRDLQSDHEKWEEEKFIPGVLIPDNLKYFDNTIKLRLGYINFQYTLDSLRHGIAIPLAVKCKNEDSPIRIELGLNGNRLEVTTELKDLQKFEIVGRIKNNKWSLFKDNLLDYNYNDSTLEVIDRAGLTIFSLRFYYPNTIAIKGYFITNNNIAIVSKKGFSLCNSKEDIPKLMNQIESISK